MFLCSCIKLQTRNQNKWCLIWIGKEVLKKIKIWPLYHSRAKAYCLYVCYIIAMNCCNLSNYFFYYLSIVRGKVTKLDKTPMVCIQLINNRRLFTHCESLFHTGLVPFICWGSKSFKKFWQGGWFLQLGILCNCPGLLLNDPIRAPYWRYEAVYTCFVFQSSFQRRWCNREEIQEDGSNLTNSLL